ncbi:hypothetical protein [Methylobacterium soli]|uniref:Uncharacterized protein n=1 Tax=Methylobacterium soli TaxID=553447 RepID=A0A6L3SXU3_9HYPH|nr:hypothetical protein [Methylobacterium soli]KAB1077927.1 hypothetical protein F6X53_17170 [Methylobacterium soli]GJE41564.1 hypothetical protein AEGHOMDF_0730 [Methylobacterium soli]
MRASAKDLPQGSAETSSETAGGFADEVRRQAVGYAGKRKADISRVVSDVGNAIRSGGSGFSDQSNIKAFVYAAAEGVEEFAEGINRRTFSEIYDEVDAVVRRRPGVTFVAAAITGFALFRFLRASEIRPVPRSRAVVPVDVFPTPDV